MTIRLSRATPQPPQPVVNLDSIEDENLKKAFEVLLNYIESLQRYLQVIVGDAFTDIAVGSVEHEVLTAAPATADLEEGQVKFSDVGGVRKGHVKVSGTLREWTLT